MDRINYHINSVWGEDKRPSVIKTINEYNNLVDRIKKNDKTWFNDFMKLVHHYYDQEPSGGNLHIVLDDGNLSLPCVSWCAGLAHGKQDDEGNDLANIMQMMTWKQRQRVYFSV